MAGMANGDGTEVKTNGGAMDSPLESADVSLPSGLKLL